MKLEEIIEIVKHDRDYFQEPQTEVQAGRLFEANKIYNMLIKYQAQLHKHVVMESLRPTDDEIGAKVEEYGFRVPYDGSNKFYDDEAIKHFRAGAEWARGFGRNAP